MPKVIPVVKNTLEPISLQNIKGTLSLNFADYHKLQSLINQYYQEYGELPVLKLNYVFELQAGNLGEIDSIAIEFEPEKQA